MKVFKWITVCAALTGGVSAMACELEIKSFELGGE
jgi:hypothetical protein